MFSISINYPLLFTILSIFVKNEMIIIENVSSFMEKRFSNTCCKMYTITEIISTFFIKKTYKSKKNLMR
jgi:hypothetical protein